MIGGGRRDWPGWWEWEIDLSAHLLKRMADRDFTEVGRPIRIEIVSPYGLELAALNRVLASLGHDPVGPEDLAPLVAA